MLINLSESFQAHEHGLVLWPSGSAAIFDAYIPYECQFESLLIWLHANGPGKAVEDDISAWTPVTHGEDSDEVPDSWLQPCPIPYIAAICGVYHGWKTSLSLSLPLCL